jgi:hypothetical protein
VNRYRSTLSALTIFGLATLGLVGVGTPASAAAPSHSEPAHSAPRPSGSDLFGTYYIDNGETSHCSDTGSGRSALAPWCDFAPVNGKTLAAGTHLLLRSGDTFTSELGKLYGSGTARDHIILGSYGTGARPHIEGSDAATDRGVWIQDASYWTVENIQISNVGAGLVFWYSSNGHRGLTIRNVYTDDVRGVFAGAPAQADLPGMYHSAGILITGSVPVTPDQTAVSGVQFSDIEGYNDDDDLDISGFNANSGGQQGFLSTTLGDHSVSDVTLTDAYFHHALSGENFDNLNHLSIVGMRLEDTGYGGNSSGTTALFFWSSSDATVADSILSGQRNTNSPDQTETDLEAFDRNIGFLGDYYGNSAGGGIEILEINGYANNYQTGLTIADSAFSANGTTATFDVTPDGPSDFDGTATANLFGPAGEALSTVGGNGGTPGPLPGWTYTDNYPALTGVIYDAGGSFGSTQGTAGWSDQYSAGNAHQSDPGSASSSSASRRWQDLPTYDSTTDQWVGRGEISATELSPARGSDSSVARAWTAPSTGTISLRGRIMAEAVQSGNGSRESARITVNGRQVWPATGSAQSLSAAVSSGFSADANVYVRAGDVVRFEVADGGGSAGPVAWIPSIAYTGPTAPVLNNGDGSISYSAGWTYQPGLAGYLDGDADYSNIPGSTVTIPFTGTGITWYGERASDHGRADVSLCNAQGAQCAPATTVDTYGATTTPQQALYTASGLAYGAHTLTITLDSATSGSDRYVDIDYFTIAGTTVNDTDSAVTYSPGWSYRQQLGGFFDSDTHISSRVGASASIAFTGTGITWIGSTSDSGRARVVVCEPGGTHCSQTQTVTPHDPLADTQQPLYSVTGLSNGPHVLVVTVLSAADRDAEVDLDGFTVDSSPRVNDNDPAVAYGAGWSYTPKTGYYDQNAHFSATTGATATVTFTGTGIQWIGGTANDHGRADVSVCDASGNNCGATTTIDTYSAAATAQRDLFTASGLAYGTHTLKILVRSDSSGTGHYTDIDAFTVSG